MKCQNPLFEVLGKVTFADGPGKGQSCNVATQMVGSGNLLSEGLMFAEKARLDKSKFVEAVKGGTAGSMVMEWLEHE